MICLQNLIKFITIYIVILSTINVNAEDNSVIHKVDELQKIREIYTKSAKDYTDARIKEINTLLGRNSNTWDFIRDVTEILKWWSIDMNSRQDVVMSELPSILSNSNDNESFQKLKEEFKVSLETAEKFWHDEVDKRLKHLRENPKVFLGLIREPVFTTEHPPLKLSAVHQPVYEAQMRNLTNIASIVKEIIRACLDKIEPNLPEKNNLTYMSYKTKFDKIISDVLLTQSTFIDSSRIFATERVSGDWRIQGKNGPSKEEFDKEYINLTKYATNVVKDLDKIEEQVYKILSK